MLYSTSAKGLKDNELVAWSRVQVNVYVIIHKPVTTSVNTYDTGFKFNLNEQTNHLVTTAC